MRFAFMIMLLFVGAPVLSAQRSVKLGLELGYAYQQELFRSGPSSRTQLSIAHFQFIPTLWVRPGRPLRSVEIISEVDFMQSIRPGSRFIVGSAEMFRFNFPVAPQWTIYGDVGPGIASSGLRVRENDGWLQYLLQAGGGVKRCRHEGRTCWLAGYRFLHLSNNNTTPPNYGLNFHSASVGMNF